MRPRTLLVLLLVVAGLAAFIWFFERDLPSTQERLEQSRKLIVLDPNEIEELVLSAHGQTVRLKRIAGDDEAGVEWSLVEPARGRADADEVEDFLERIRSLQKKRTLEDASREELGLTAPRAEVRFGSEANAVTLRLGSQIPASDNTVAEVGTGPPFYVVRDSLFEDIARDPDEWRSRDAIPIERSRIQRIDILIPANGITLERGDDGFRIAAPVEDEADEARVSKLLTGLIGLKIEEFLDQPGAAPELEAPAASVKVTIEGRGEPITVSIAAAAVVTGDNSEAATFSDSEPLVAVRVDGQTFLARTDLASQLALSAEAWPSPKWSGRQTFEIDRVRVTRGGEELSLERSEGKWLRGGDEIRYSIVDGFLRAVTGASGTPVEPASVAEDERSPADLEITLEFSDGEERLRLFATGAGHLAGRKGRDVLLRMEDSSIEEILAKLEVLRTAPALEDPVTTENATDSLD